MNGKESKKIMSGQSGQTLVELMVAMSIFAIFITVAIGGFIQSLANQRLVLKLISATDNMSLTLEQMMREMRVGTNFIAITNGVQFDWPDTEAGLPVMRRITYQQAQAPWGLAIERTKATLDSSGNIVGMPVSEFITADNVGVSYFNVANSLAHNPGPGPCRINMTLGITATDKNISITNYIQSTVSSRIFTSTCQ
jgi:prepilin-type N-terminal cleavage/methylation domain-containing protein